MINKLMTKKGRLLLYFHTLKYLQWPQLWFRIHYAIKRLRLKPVDVGVRRKWLHLWQAPQSSKPCSIINLNEVIFLGEKGNLLTVSDWNCIKKSKLWLYNLHYLDDLNKHDPSNVGMLQEFIFKWINENPPGHGNGWEPYPLSIRLVNLVKWYARQTKELTTLEKQSFGMQAQALAKQLEFHIKGNHLLMNGKALVFVGVFFDGVQARRWLKKGLQLLDKEINEQFLPDGAHFELSPMYHASLLWDLCDLVNLANRSGLAELLNRKNHWLNTIRQGMVWLQCMMHPDGEISFFNDAAFGIAPTYVELQQYIQDSDIKIVQQEKLMLHHLEASGYCVVNIDENSKAILDVGPIGPTYQPGHAHADTLSFELSLYGQRFLVNSGTSQYGEDAKRQAQRSTRAHNTVTINDENSSEVWAGFRVARRAKPIHLVVEEATQELFIACSHNGYLRLPGRNIHRREWFFKPHLMIIQDYVSGLFTTAESRLYFHPEIKLKKCSEERIDCELKSGEIVSIHILLAQKIDIEATEWNPYFGISEKNQCIVAYFTGPKLITEIAW